MKNKMGAGGKSPLLVSVASGKGGVGKTSVVINLAAVLNDQGKRVLVVDCDLGLANADILLGLSPEKNLYNVLKNDASIQEVILDSGAGFDLLPASSGVSEMTELSPEDHGRLISQIGALFHQYDLILLDTGAGISSTVVRFNHAAHETIVLLTPEPTSVTDAYALIKVFKSRLRRTDFHLIVNRVKDEREGLKVGHNLSRVAYKFIKINAAYLGHIVEDESLGLTVRRQQVCAKMFPDAASTMCFVELAKKISTWTPKEERSYLDLFARA